MSLLYTPNIFQLLNNLSWIITVWYLIIRKIKENTLSSPIADDNFVIIPIFNPSTYSTSLCCPLNTNRLILLCHSKIKNVVSTIIRRTSAGSTHENVKFFARRNKFGYDWLLRETYIPCKKASNFCFRSFMEGFLGGFTEIRAFSW